MPDRRTAEHVEVTSTEDGPSEIPVDAGSRHQDHNGDEAHASQEVQRETQTEQRPSVVSIESTNADDDTPEQYEPGSPDGTKKLAQTSENTDLERSETAVQPLHTVFTKPQKRFIIAMAAAAGFFSPFSANIYFPALNVLARELHVSSGSINLTLTTYMIFQGLAPTVFGDLADMAGRRPAYIIGFIIYIAACIGIALQDSYVALLLLRCLQSSGSSGTIALASGVAADVATSAERGTYVGWVSTGALLGPAIGPVIGGILAQYAGWRWIFWFLVILAGIYFIPLVVAFPETGRNVVGDGSIPPQGWNMSLLNYLEVRRARRAESKASNASTLALERSKSRESQRSARDALRAKRKLRIPNPFNTLKLALQPDVGLLLLYNSLVYTAFYDVMSSVPYLFSEIYGFDELQIGLCFIPFGIGCFIAPMLNGRLLDWNFRRLAAKHGIPVVKGRTTDLRDFPLEQARIMIALPLIFIGDACMLCYGWVVQVNAPLAAPLVLQFIMGVTLTGAFNVNGVMLVDYYPMSPSTATAGNNLFRCLMGAGGTALIIPMIDAMGRGWCFTFIAGVVLLSTSIMWVLLKKGPAWREKRRVRMEEDRAREAGQLPG